MDWNRKHWPLGVQRLAHWPWHSLSQVSVGTRQGAPPWEYFLTLCSLQQPAWTCLSEPGSLHHCWQRLHELSWALLFLAQLEMEHLTPLVDHLAAYFPIPGFSHFLPLAPTLLPPPPSPRPYRDRLLPSTSQNIQPTMSDPVELSKVCLAVDCHQSLTFVCCPTHLWSVSLLNWSVDFSAHGVQPRTKL